ncbi:MAG: ribosomal-processing cysteine protease Prp [Breznakia sp.]
MINIKFCLHDEIIHEVCIKGHSDSADSGEDLVCAGVSSIGVGALNALQELAKDKCTLDMKKGFIKIVTTSKDEVTQTILKTLYIQLLSIEEVYKQYIQIEKVEV